MSDSYRKVLILYLCSNQFKSRLPQRGAAPMPTASRWGGAPLGLANGLVIHSYTKTSYLT